MTFWEIHGEDRDAFDHDLLVEGIVDDPNENPREYHEPAAPDADGWRGGPWATP